MYNADELVEKTLFADNSADGSQIELNDKDVQMLEKDMEELEVGNSSGETHIQEVIRESANEVVEEISEIKLKVYENQKWTKIKVVGKLFKNKKVIDYGKIDDSYHDMTALQIFYKVTDF